jgi:hypothetical protein
MRTTNDVFTNAFQLLASTVREFHINGRACLGATLKPRLYQQHFDERLLGFRKFGDFLRAAEAAGYVRLSATPGGDIAISPGSGLRNPEILAPFPGDTAPTIATAITPSITSSSAAPIRVRQDLWNAFNSFSDKWFYDASTDTAFRDSHGTGGWDGQPTLARPNTIPIPSGRERVAEWMRSFATMQDLEAKAQLSNALDRNAGLYEFNNLTRSQGLLRLWSRFHIQNVLAAIEAWAASNKVHPRNVASPLHLPVLPVPSEIRTPEPSPKGPTSEVTPPPGPPSPLNARLESLIDNLINDLISLRGLLRVVGPKRS